MAKKQTRRSISVSAVAFERAQAVAEKAGISLSKFTEAALDAMIRTGPTHESVGIRVAVNDRVALSMTEVEVGDVQVVYDEDPR